MGIFGKQQYDFSNEVLSGEVSPDKSKCLIKVPSVLPQRNRPHRDILQLYDLHSKMLLVEVDLSTSEVDFCFDPRFCWKRIAITNFDAQSNNNSLCLVNIDMQWRVDHTNPQVGWLD